MSRSSGLHSEAIDRNKMETDPVRDVTGCRLLFGILSALTRRVQARHDGQQVYFHLEKKSHLKKFGVVCENELHELSR